MERFDLIANCVTRLMRLEHEHRQYMPEIDHEPMIAWAAERTDA